MSHSGLRRVGVLVAFAASALIVAGCDPVRSVWVDNQSASPVIVTVDGFPSGLVGAGVSDLAFQTIGTTSDPGQVAVWTTDCHLIGQTNMPADSAWLLLVTLPADGGVVFKANANLGERSPHGTVSDTRDCQQ